MTEQAVSVAALDPIIPAAVREATLTVYLLASVPPPNYGPSRSRIVCYGATAVRFRTSTSLRTGSIGPA